MTVSSYIPLIQQAAAANNVPLPIAMGLFGQESGLGASSANIGQVLSSTAANPGYGLAPLDDVNDPAKNIDFSLKYFKARANAAGASNLDDPAQATAALHAYNGGGDPSYAEKVLTRAKNFATSGTPTLTGFGGSAPGGAASSLLGPQVGTQAQLPPPMPSDFGQAGPSSQAPHIDPSTAVDPMLSAGLGMMGGGSWAGGMKNAQEALTQAAQQRLEIAKANATLDNSAAERDAEAPTRAANAATLRAQAWNTMNAPSTITAQQAAQNTIEQRKTDAQLQAAMAQREYMAQLAKGQPQTLVVPDEAGGIKQTLTMQGSPSGPIYTDPATGKTSRNLADLGVTGTPIPANLYNAQEQRGLKLQQANSKDLTGILQGGQAATENLQNVQRILNNATNPDALTGPGAVKDFERAFDSFTGSNTFGSMSAEQQAKMDLGTLNWSTVKEGAKGVRLTQSEWGVLQKNFPNIQTDPAARAAVLGVMAHGLAQKKALADAWQSEDPKVQSAALNAPSGVASWSYNTFDKLTRDNPMPGSQAPAPGGAPQGGPAAPAAPSSRPPLTAFMRSGPTPPQAPQGGQGQLNPWDVNPTP